MFGGIPFQSRRCVGWFDAAMVAFTIFVCVCVVVRLFLVCRFICFVFDFVCFVGSLFCFACCFAFIVLCGCVRFIAGIGRCVATMSSRFARTFLWAMDECHVFSFFFVCCDFVSCFVCCFLSFLSL